MNHSPALPPPPALDLLVERGPLALFLDFDGTLVELADTPDAIHVPPTLCARLKALADRLDGRLALVSGRALDDIESYLPDIAVARAGSHGAARKHADGRWLGEEPEGLPEAAVQAMRRLAEREGLLYETKSHGGAQPWFVGDDVTDDDGFSACAEMGGGGVLVGDRQGSSAHFALANVARTIEWLGL